MMLATRLALAAALVALGAACSQPAGPKPTGPTAVPADAGVTVDAPGPSQEEKLAAIQKAMNELDEGAQHCWAAAATDRFDIEGELKVLIEIQAAGAKAQVVSDGAKNAKLAACLVQVIGGYRFAPPLVGETIQLPFAFKAPDGQSVIDRKLVTWNGQGGVSVAVLLDENNTGNAAASMFELAIAKGSSTGWRKTGRAELWFFLGAARVGNPPIIKAPYRNVEAGDMMYVPAGGVRSVSAAGADVHAMIVAFPGGREGAARAGALPTPEAKPEQAKPPVIFSAASAKTYGPATIYVEPATLKDAKFSASVLKLPSGAKVPEHVHANETELLYMLEGSGTMTVAGAEIAITPNSVVQVPPNTKHAFAASSDVRAVQLYTPAGPEQRFKKQP